MKQPVYGVVTEPDDLAILLGGGCRDPGQTVKEGGLPKDAARLVYGQNFFLPLVREYAGPDRAGGETVEILRLLALEIDDLSPAIGDGLSGGKKRRKELRRQAGFRGRKAVVVHKITS
jgi:hypothetical protein